MGLIPESVYRLSHIYMRAECDYAYLLWAVWNAELWGLDDRADAARVAMIRNEKGGKKNG